MSNYWLFVLCALIFASSIDQGIRDAAQEKELREIRAELIKMNTQKEKIQ